jgi:hypothetical protein
MKFILYKIKVDTVERIGDGDGRLLLFVETVGGKPGRAKEQ